jgi:hypothetical protein
MLATIATLVRRINILGVAIGLGATLMLGLAFAAPISARHWHAHGLHHAHRLHVGSAAWWRRMDRAGRGGRQQP